MSDAWDAVLKEALSVGGKKALPGAKMRILFERFAKEKGLDFPPPAMEGRKFADFLGDFPHVIALRKRPHQDFLVAPADQPELLASAASFGPNQGRLRQDLYQALTRLGSQDKQAFYFPASDTVVWEARGAVLDGAIPFPPVTPELEDRKGFAAQCDLEDRDEVGASVAVKQSFLQVIREKSLAKKWHHYRLQVLIDRLKEWAESHELAWGATWIEGATKSVDPAGDAVLSAPGTGDLYAAFRMLGRSLSEDELKRIVVPMDVLMKVLNARN